MNWRRRRRTKPTEGKSPKYLEQQKNDDPLSILGSGKNLFWVTKLIFLNFFLRLWRKKNFSASKKNYCRIVFNIEKPAKAILLRARQKKRESEGKPLSSLKENTAFNKWNFCWFEFFLRSITWEGGKEESGVFGERNHNAEGGKTN